MPHSYRITSRVLYSAQCHRHHYTLHAFEQFGALYRHNLDDQHPTRPGFEHSSSSFEPQQDRMGHRDDLVISNIYKLIRVPINVASNIYKHDK